VPSKSALDAHDRAHGPIVVARDDVGAQYAWELSGAHTFGGAVDRDVLWHQAVLGHVETQVLGAPELDVAVLALFECEGRGAFGGHHDHRGDAFLIRILQHRASKLDPDAIFAVNVDVNVHPTPATPHRGGRRIRLGETLVNASQTLDLGAASVGKHLTTCCQHAVQQASPIGMHALMNSGKTLCTDTIRYLHVFFFSFCDRLSV